MSITKLPEFTPKARLLWDAMQSQVKTKLLSNVYCGDCKDSVRIVNFKGSIYKSNLYLEGCCDVCGAEVSRLFD